MIKIDLLKPEKKELKEIPAPTLEKIEKKKKFPIESLIILLAIIISVFLVFSVTNAINEENGLIEQAKTEKEKLKDVQDKLNKRQKLEDLLERKINLINESQAKQEVAVRIMDVLSQKLPEWVWMTEVSFIPPEVRIKGRAFSNSLIADYIYNLENSSYFSSIRFIGSSQRRIRNNLVQEFSLTAQYMHQSTSESPSEDNQEKEKK